MTDTQKPDLAAIRARADAAMEARRGPWRVIDEAPIEARCAVIASSYDVPALLAYIDALKSEHAATVARLEAENQCDVCGGSGVPINLRHCMCNGTGHMSEAARTLRNEVVKLERSLAERDAEIRRLNETIDETPSAYVIAERMRREFPQNKHAQEWADWIDKQTPLSPPASPPQAERPAPPDPPLSECEAPYYCPYPAPDHVAGRHFCAGHIDSFGKEYRLPNAKPQGAEAHGISDTCWCSQCDEASPGHVLPMRMNLCPKCGNKRCPKAEWHGFKCSGSNDPNQPPGVPEPQRAEAPKLVTLYSPDNDPHDLSFTEVLTGYDDASSNDRPRDYLRADLADEAVRLLRTLVYYWSGNAEREALDFLARLDAGSKT